MSDMRAALVAIQELHTTYKEWIDDREYLLVCEHCRVFHPCPTRKLADQGLGGEQRA